MAKREHLEILRAGVQPWNEWRANAQIAPVDLARADLRGMHLSGANFREVDLSEAELREADLVYADFSEANLHSANFREARLVGATFDSCNLSGSNFEGANLNSANFRESNLVRARFYAAQCLRTLFQDSVLDDVVFSKALFGATVFADVELNKTTGLESCEHIRSSSLDMSALQKSKELPELFLRGCGLPDRLIEYLPSLTDQPIQLYSCFISFTESDDEFAERLYNDLQGCGVRCWRWKEDARGGRSLIGEVDAAIRVFDKLMVIFSKKSLLSGPVIREIERALRREDQLTSDGQKPEVLFPLRLDDSIFQWKHPRKDDVLEKVVSDFRNWKDHSQYRRSFGKLLQDLKLDKERF